MKNSQLFYRLSKMGYLLRNAANGLAGDPRRHMTAEQAMAMSDCGANFPQHVVLHPSVPDSTEMLKVKNIYAPFSTIELKGVSFQCHGITAHEVRLANHKAGRFMMQHSDVAKISVQHADVVAIENVTALRELEIVQTKRLVLDGLPQLESLNIDDLKSIEHCSVGNVPDIQDGPVSVFTATISAKALTDGKDIAFQKYHGSKEKVFLKNFLDIEINDRKALDAAVELGAFRLSEAAIQETGSEKEKKDFIIGEAELRACLDSCEETVAMNEGLHKAIIKKFHLSPLKF